MTTPNHSKQTNVAALRTSGEKISIRAPFFAIVLIVTLSNYLVQFPINDWLTWGAFSYPISFLVTELTNRFYGPRTARHVVYIGFAVAVGLSVWLSTPKIAFASGAAFLLSQLLDISVFNQLRRGAWWQAPLFASILASLIDTLLFWSLAFWGEDVPLYSWALGDFLVKLAVDLVMLTPFRIAVRQIPTN